MPTAPSRRTLATFGLVFSILSCVEVPPKITSLPPGGLSVRVHIFGAAANEVNQAFQAANNNNPSFHVVVDGGEGDIVVGLENDSPMCVPPTGLCSFKVSYRVRDKAGEAVASNTTSINAQGDHCEDLCAKAVNNVVVKLIEEAATALAAGPPPPDDAGAAKGAKGKPAAKAAPALCGIATGPRLPSEEAEARAAQVEVLKRVGVIDQTEYDCLRKAYLSRL
jgi:hypothetical protein